MSEWLDFGPCSFATSNEGKVLFPDDGITKGQLIDYYRKIASVMLPHLEDRPLTLQRFPDGIGEDGFYQQDEPDYFPDWVDTCRVPRTGDPARGPVEHVLCNNEATLTYLANQAAITLHAWLATAPKLKRRGRLYLDVMRNAYGQTSVAPYSVRALPGAPIAAPLTLDELGDPRLNPRRWHLKNIMRRLGQRTDAWQDIRRHAGSPRGARRELARLA